MMKRILMVCLATMSLRYVAAAQDTPHYEVFAGGSYLRVHASGAELTQLLGEPALQFQPHNQNFNLLGWDASVTENVNHWFGAELDASGFYGSPSAGFLYPAAQLVTSSPNFSQKVPVVSRTQTFMFGPKLSWRRERHVVFFAHLPVGVGYANASLGESAVVASNFSVLPTGTLKSSTGLALAPGVGMDVKVNERVMVRVMQLDYLMTHYFGERQDNARVSAGVNLTFGEK
jgi:opacity protein-like surface antigen